MVVLPLIGWLECNGQSTSAYPELAAVVGSNVPDLRGQFVRGWDNGRGLDPGRTVRSSQNESYKSHNHSSSAANDHTHSINNGGSHIHSIGNAGSHTHGINANGNHNHSYSYRKVRGDGDTDGSNNIADDSTQSGTTSTAGNHSHSMNSAGNHNHSMGSAGNHNHTMNLSGGHNHTIGQSGGTETRPRNFALMYIIRY